MWDLPSGCGSGWSLMRCFIKCHVPVHRLLKAWMLNISRCRQLTHISTNYAAAAFKLSRKYWCAASFTTHVFRAFAFLAPRLLVIIMRQINAPLVLCCMLKKWAGLNSLLTLILIKVKDFLTFQSITSMDSQKWWSTLVCGDIVVLFYWDLLMLGSKLFVIKHTPHILIFLRAILQYRIKIITFDEN